MDFFKGCVKLNKNKNNPGSELEECYKLKSQFCCKEIIEVTVLEMPDEFEPKAKETPKKELCEQSVLLTDSNTCYSQYGGPLYKLESTNTKKEKILNWISLCLWNCSAGCQQLPTND